MCVCVCDSMGGLMGEAERNWLWRHAGEVRIKKFPMPPVSLIIMSLQSVKTNGIGENGCERARWQNLFTVFVQ